MQTPTQKSSLIEALEHLLMVASREAKSEGWALYEMEPVQRCWTRRCGDGNTERACISFPLWGADELAGILEFAFPDGAVSAEQRGILERAAAAAESILQFGHRTRTLQELAERLSDVESELAALKIAERARGLLSEEPRESAVDRLAEHISSVLGATALKDTLSAQLAELEERLEERRAVSKAKALLQKTQGLSEQEAYIRLRGTSRRNRKRLGLVARETLDQQGRARSFGAAR